VLSDTFSEGKLKDLRSSFPLDQPTELDDRDFLDDSDLEDVEDDANPPIEIPGGMSEDQKSPLKSPMLDPVFTSPLLRQISRLAIGRLVDGSAPSVCTTQSMDPGTHLGKVVVLHDIPFVT